MTVSWVIALASGVKVWIMRRKAKRHTPEWERQCIKEKERERDTQTQVTQSSNNKDMCTCVYFILEQREREGEEFAWQIEKWNSNSWDRESIWYWIQLWSRVPFTLITVKSERESAREKEKEREEKRKSEKQTGLCERLSEKDTDEEIPLLESQCKLDSWSREMKWPNAILCNSFRERERGRERERERGRESMSEWKNKVQTEIGNSFKVRWHVICDRSRGNRVLWQTCDIQLDHKESKVATCCLYYCLNQKEIWVQACICKKILPCRCRWVRVKGRESKWVGDSVVDHKEKRRKVAWF